MRWFRSKLRFGAYSALVALALQFALTFAHVHGILPAPTATASAKLYAPVLPPDGLPANPEPNGVAADFCAVCSLVQMASSSAPSATPSLPLPTLAEPAPFAISTDRVPAASRPPLFQARAPPIA